MAKSKLRYNFKNMAIGEQFPVKASEEQKVRNAVSHFTKDSEPDWIFKVASVGKDFICFRVK